MTIPLLLFCVLGAQGGPTTVLEIQSKETVHLLNTVRLVYESGAKSAFHMRVFVSRSEGECVEGSACEPDDLLVAVSSFDEYPEQKAFRLHLPGIYKRASVVSLPMFEGGTFGVAVYTEAASRKESCVLYSVSLQEMRRATSACPK